MRLLIVIFKKKFKINLRINLAFLTWEKVNFIAGKLVNSIFYSLHNNIKLKVFKDLMNKLILHRLLILIEIFTKKLLKFLGIKGKFLIFISLKTRFKKNSKMINFKKNYKL